MFDVNFSTDDKRLPLKITAAFLLAAAAVNIPVGAMDVVIRTFIDNPVAKVLANASGIGVVVGGVYLLECELTKTLRKLNPMNRPDLSGVFTTTISAMFSALFANAVVINQIRDFKGKVGVGDTVLSAVAAVCTYRRIKHHLTENHWRPPRTPPRRDSNPDKLG